MQLRQRPMYAIFVLLSKCLSVSVSHVYCLPMCYCLYVMFVELAWSSLTLHGWLPDNDFFGTPLLVAVKPIAHSLLKFMQYTLTNDMIFHVHPVACYVGKDRPSKGKVHLPHILCFNYIRYLLLLFTLIRSTIIAQHTVTVCVVVS